MATTEATSEILKYIEQMPDFAQKICKKLRSIILKADPEIREDWKWGPNYNCNGMICGYGGFTHHVKLTFFNGSEMKDPKHIFNHCVDNEFSRSIKYTDVSQIDEKTLISYLKESIEINKNGFKRVVKDKTVKVPEYLEKQIRKNKAAFTFFDNLSYGYKKDYVQWITTAKREETRNERIEKLIAKCAKGKKMNDK